MKHLVFAIGIGLSTVASAQDLGRLFFSPEQRAALDARRKARVPDKPAAAPIVASPTTRLDGYVRRSDGRSTVWVNGVEVDQASPRADGSVAVVVGDSEARVQLKPGEVLDRGSGEVSDVLGSNGEIRVRPAK
ncbi:MAG: hypothetical protein A3G81_17810 [Betaproteobacteria bacterium RIFCSPLOWO2_12_FULL_65_14]|nr:MAG: hypothetical protein A3G81_17810 [Betaproteobacteria bacterium RIFCSPLOWO2_12_FULL_65_14]